MTLSAQEWHQRCSQQARWTQNLRDYLFGRVNLKKAQRILDVGCGSGALLPELVSRSQATIFGLDLSAANLALAIQNAGEAHLVQGDAHALPYLDGAFDICLCHFLLLWVRHALQVVREMRRVTRPAGYVLILAEPDYGGRIDYPDALAEIGQWQSEALQRQGAQPFIGRRLRSLMQQAGLIDIECGVLGGQWREAPSSAERQLEWSVLEADLEGCIPSSKLKQFEEMDRIAWEKGERILFVPTFYAWGRVA